jgi:hypothetical protein
MYSGLSFGDMSERVGVMVLRETRGNFPPVRQSALQAHRIVVAFLGSHPTPQILDCTLNLWESAAEIGPLSRPSSYQQRPRPNCGSRVRRRYNTRQSGSLANDRCHLTKPHPCACVLLLRGRSSTPDLVETFLWVPQSKQLQNTRRGAVLAI